MGVVWFHFIAFVLVSFRSVLFDLFRILSTEDESVKTLSISLLGLPAPPHTRVHLSEVRERESGVSLDAQKAASKRPEWA